MVEPESCPGSASGRNRTTSPGSGRNLPPAGEFGTEGDLQPALVLLRDVDQESGGERAAHAVVRRGAADLEAVSDPLHGRVLVTVLE